MKTIFVLSLFANLQCVLYS